MAWEHLPPSANDLHFNVRKEESRMLLKGVTMINHLKSKILITGRNFCYLRSPLVARKKKKKIITGYSPPKVERCLYCLCHFIGHSAEFRVKARYIYLVSD